MRPSTRGSKRASSPGPTAFRGLRFGHHYQLRARVVDLAGNSLTGKEADEVLEALVVNRRHQPLLPMDPKEFRYRRYEPIAPPTLALREELTEGETPEVLVIRSNLAPVGPDAQIAEVRQAFGAVIDLVRAAQQAGEIKDGDAKHISALIFGAAYGMADLAVSNREAVIWRRCCSTCWLAARSPATRLPNNPPAFR